MSAVPSRIAVVGASGLVGSAIVRAINARGFEALRVRAPRLRVDGHRDGGVYGMPLDLVMVRELAERLGEATVVVNAAGLSTANGRDKSALFGANAVLPRLLFGACAETGVARLIHVSSASVQGGGILDESSATMPFSVYSASKAAGEHALLQEARRSGNRVEVTCFRPTSVQDPDRSVTRSLVRIARSPLASVAGPGTGPTPQVLLDNVADAITFAALHRGALPDVVLQPWEGLSCARFLHILGAQEPRHVPERVARGVVAALHGVEHRHGALPGTRRRLEVMWWGQRQRSSWLDSQGWRPIVGIDGWQALGAEMRAKEHV